jgi:ribosomal-protein-alanine N-acetyltransferase
MDETLTITAAGDDDYAWCAELMASSEPWISLGRNLEGAHAALHRPGTRLFVARDSGQLVGFLLLADYGFAGSPYVASIAVAPDLRGRGIGAEMLRWVEQLYAHRRDLFLLVSSFNTRAQKLYFSLGYEQAGELPDYVVPGYSELILRKRLG